MRVKGVLYSTTGDCAVTHSSIPNAAGLEEDAAARSREAAELDLLDDRELSGRDDDDSLLKASVSRMMRSTSRDVLCLCSWRRST